MMIYFIRITESTKDVSMQRGDIIQLCSMHSTDNAYRMTNRDGDYVYGTPAELMETIEANGGKSELYYYDEEKVGVFKCVFSNHPKFERGKVYVCDIGNYNADAECPFASCISGVNLTNDDVREEPEYDDSPRMLFVNILHSLVEKENARFEQSDFKHYLEQTLPKLDAEFVPKKFDKYIPADSEIEKIKREMIRLFDEYDHVWSQEGVDDILYEWRENKGELISAFMAHPNYNGNFQIVFSNETYVSEINKNAGYNFMAWVRSEFSPNTQLEEKKIFGKTMDELNLERTYLNATLPLVVPIESNGKLELLNYDLFENKRREIDKIAFTLQLFGDSKYTEASVEKKRNCGYLFDWIASYHTDRIDEASADEINLYLPELRVREGQKTTKVVGKIMRYYGIDKIDGYAKMFAKYCDAINVIKVTRHTILSVNPIDYLTQSFGNSWSSCHTIDKTNKRNVNGDHYEGQYCSGTMSYMLDKSSFVLYTVDKNYEGNTFYEMPKINRCMFHVENNKIVQGRCYPQAEDGNNELYTQLRVLVQKTIADIWKVPNMWRLKRSSLGDYIRSTGTNYEDYFHYSGCNVSLFKFSDSETLNNPVHIGHYPICPSCGEEHDESNYLACDDCRNDWYCPECGAIVSRGDDYYEIDGERFHADCVFWCEYHERYEPRSVMYTEVYNYGLICEQAYESGNFNYCDDCEEVRYSDVTEVVRENGYHDFVCDDCLEENYRYCEEDDEYVHVNLTESCYQCGRVVSMENAHETPDRMIVCEHCYAEMENTEAV